MKQNILFILLLSLIFFSLNETFGANIYQDARNAPDESEQEAVKEKPRPAPQPRIRYLDVINELSDSILILNQTLKEINLRLEEISLEKESLSVELIEATAPVDQPKVEKEKSSFLGIKIESGLKTALFILFLVVVFTVKTLLLVACRGAVVKAKKKNLQYDELAAEFENYRKASRERFEKQSIDHFNELKKLGKM